MGAREERAISANSPLIPMPRRSACSSRKDPVVHRKVHDHAVFQADELRVLPADFEDGVHRLPEIPLADEGGSGLVGGDFILNGIGTYKLPDKLPPRPRRADAANPDSLPELLPQVAETLRHHLHRPSLRAHVDFLQ